jgi:arylsulfatase A-like enzyme
VRVPLVIAVPGVSPRVISGPVELIDIAPTGARPPRHPHPRRMRGTDLGPWLATPPAPPARLPPAFAEVADKRMIVWGTDKLICEMNWGYCSFYDLAADPHEKNNLAEQKDRVDRAGALKRPPRRLARRSRAATSRSSCAAWPTPTAAPSPRRSSAGASAT